MSTPSDPRNSRARRDAAPSIDAASVLGEWIGSTPDGTPLVLLDTGTHDIYALDWDAP
jgi:hypothetical protein